MYSAESFEISNMYYYEGRNKHLRSEKSFSFNSSSLQWICKSKILHQIKDVITANYETQQQNENQKSIIKTNLHYNPECRYNVYQ